LQSNHDRIKPENTLPTFSTPPAIFGTNNSNSQNRFPASHSEFVVLEDEQFATGNCSFDVNFSETENLTKNGGLTENVDETASKTSKESFEIAVKSASTDSEDTDSEEGETTIDGATSELPSLGSAKHSAGECKRCNFFAKGRCLNGLDCTFCHLPHEKRKPSRQEKRERREAWLLSQKEPNQPEVVSEEMDSGVKQQSSDKLGLLPMSSANFHTHTHTKNVPAASSPSCATGRPYPLLPPGLAPPSKMFDLWQPDAEVSPLRMCSLLMPRSMATTPAPISLAEPLGISALHLGETGSPLLLSTVPSPAPSPHAALSDSMPVSLLTRTIGTQTALELICTCCGKSDVKLGGELSKVGQDHSSSNSLAGKSGHMQWTRGELLSFRDGAEKAAPPSAPSILFQSIPFPQ